MHLLLSLESWRPCSEVHAHNRLGLCALLLVLPIVQHLTPGTWPSIQLELCVPMTTQLSGFWNCWGSRHACDADMHAMWVCITIFCQSDMLLSMWHISNFHPAFARERRQVPLQRPVTTVVNMILCSKQDSKIRNESCVPLLDSGPWYEPPEYVFIVNSSLVIFLVMATTLELVRRARMIPSCIIGNGTKNQP